jgi:hypothetical protein
VDRSDRTERRESHDRTEPRERADPIEPPEATEPMLAMDRAEPTLPTESTEPRHPMQSTESVDHRDQRDLAPVLMARSWPNGGSRGSRTTVEVGEPATRSCCAVSPGVPCLSSCRRSHEAALGTERR